MKKYILILLIFGIIGYNYIYQDHRDIETEPPKFIINSKSLHNQFSENPSYFQKKYLNKTIEVSGVITDKNANNLTIDDKVFCQFPDNNQNIPDNKLPITVKGRVIGYDDFLEQVKLDQCSIIKK